MLTVAVTGQASSSLGSSSKCKTGADTKPRRLKALVNSTHGKGIPKCFGTKRKKSGSSNRFKI